MAKLVRGRGKIWEIKIESKKKMIMSRLILYILHEI